MPATVWDGISIALGTSGADNYSSSSANTAYYAGAGDDTLSSAIPDAPVFLIGGDGSDSYILDGLAHAVIVEYGVANSGSDKIILRNIPLGGSWSATIIDGRHLFAFIGGSGVNNMDLLVTDFFSNLNTIESIDFGNVAGEFSGVFSRDQLITAITSQNPSRQTWTQADFSVLDGYLTLHNIGKVEIDSAILDAQSSPNYPLLKFTSPDTNILVGNVSFGETQYGYGISSFGGSPLLVTVGGIAASPTYPGSGWEAVAAAQSATVGSAYQLYWKNTITNQYAVWDLDSLGAYKTGKSLTLAEVFAVESEYSLDLNGDSNTGLVFTSPDTNILVGNVSFGGTRYGYGISYLDGSPLLVTVGGIAASPTYPGSGWEAVAAAQSATVGSAYQLYWKNTITNQYAVWDLDSLGAYKTGKSLTLAEVFAVESEYSLDLNGDSNTGLVFTSPDTNILVGNVSFGGTRYGYGISYLDGSPLLVTVGGIAASPTYPGSGWEAVAAAQSATVGTAYQLYWKNTSTNQYAVWDLDSLGAYKNGKSISLVEVLGKTDLQFTSPATNILVGDVSFGETQYGYGISSFGGSPLLVTVGGIAASPTYPGSGWEAVAAAQSATVGSAYQLYWKNTITNQYAVWDLDSLGAYKTGKSLTLAEVFAVESEYSLDLNGDSNTGLVFTSPDTNILVGNVSFGGTRYGYGISYLDGSPLLVTVGGIAASPTYPGSGWEAVAAAQSATVGSAYQLYWKNTITNQYAVWDLDSLGAYKTGKSLTLAEVFGVESEYSLDLNGDSNTGLLFTSPDTNILVGNVSFGGTRYGYGISYLDGSPLLVTVGGIAASPTYPGSGWEAVAAAQSATVDTAYQLYWKNTITNQYAVWDLDSLGAYKIGKSLTLAEVFAVESEYSFDLNGDSSTGAPLSFQATVLLGFLSGNRSVYYNGPNPGDVTVEIQSLLGADDNLTFTASTATTNFQSTTITYAYLVSQPTTFLASYTLLARASDSLVSVELTNTDLDISNYSAYTSDSATYAALTTDSSLLNLLSTYSDLPADSSSGAYSSAVNVGFEAVASLFDQNGLFKQINSQVKSVYKYMGVDKVFGLDSKIEQVLDLDRQFALDASLLTKKWFSTQLWIQELKTTPVQDVGNPFRETNLRASNGMFLANAQSGPAADVVTGNLYFQNLYGTGSPNYNFLDSNALSAITALPQASIYLGTVQKDLLTGTDSDDLFIPLAGYDTITMGGGNDLLLLASVAGHPMVTDFSDQEDKVFLSNKIFTSLRQTAGALDSGNFVLGTLALDSNDFILYDKGTGGLFYDADGNGSVAPIQIAALGSNAHPLLSTSNFIIG